MNRDQNVGEMDPSPASPAAASTTMEIQPRTEAPRPQTRRHVQQQQQQDEQKQLQRTSATTEKTSPKQQNSESNNYTRLNERTAFDEENAVPRASYFLLGAPPSVSIAAKTTPTASDAKKRRSSPPNTSHKRSSSSRAMSGTENFFKQHISFVHDQPTDPDFVPSPSWFQDHPHQEYVHLLSTPGSSKIDRHHQNLLSPNSLNCRTGGSNNFTTAARPSYYHHSFSPGSIFPRSERPSAKAHYHLHRHHNDKTEGNGDDGDDNDDDGENEFGTSLRQNFLRKHPKTVNNNTNNNNDNNDLCESATTPSQRGRGRSGRVNQQQRSGESLQESLNALRRRQAIRSALEGAAAEGSFGGGDDDDDENENERSPDYWLSPSQQEESERRIRRSAVFSTANRGRTRSSEQGRQQQQQHQATSQSALTTANSNGLGAPPLPRPSLLEKLRAFTSAEQFGEELIFALAKDIFESLLVGLWILIKKVGRWFHGLLYFMWFGVALVHGEENEEQQQQQQKQQQQSQAQFAKNNDSRNSTSTTSDVYSSSFASSPFPSFYRDAFFSTWSPHELLEATDLPMTNAFVPTTTKSTAPGIAHSSSVEMLRPTPAPPFWWLGMMEISGRHFIETQWAQAFAESIYLPCVREARRMWLVHEDEVLRGHDLVRRVERRGGVDDFDDVDEDLDDALRQRRLGRGRFREL